MINLIMIFIIIVLIINNLWLRYQIIQIEDIIPNYDKAISNIERIYLQLLEKLRILYVEEGYEEDDELGIFFTLIKDSLREIDKLYKILKK